MSASTYTPKQPYRPNLNSEPLSYNAKQAIYQAYDAIGEHDNVLNTHSSQIAALQSAQSSASTSTNTGSKINALNPTEGYFVNGYSGGNLSTSQVAYTDLTGLPVLAQTAAAVSHQWLNSYNATTGAFTLSQPAFSDISGNLSESQLPTAGASGTVTLAKLTTGGSNGSLTITNGIITAITNPS